MRTCISVFAMACLLFVISCDSSMTSECGIDIKLSESLFNDGAQDSNMNINNMIWDGNCLSVSVSYGGGCEEHEFDYAIDGNILKTNPPILELAIIHDNTDLCEAYITETLSFGLGDHSVFDENPIMFIKVKGTEFEYLLEQ